MEKFIESRPSASSRQRRAVLPIHNLARQAEGGAPVSLGDASQLQRTFGNRALGRLLPRTPANRIQRVGGTGGNQPPLQLADRPWEEIEEEEARTGKHAKAKQQLLLADRPWSEIEEEEAKSGKRAKPKQPLLLMDRPWKEIEDEQKAAEIVGNALNPQAQQEAKSKEGAQALFRGDNKDEWGREKKPVTSVTVDKTFFREPPRLADRPWEEVAQIEEAKLDDFVRSLNSRVYKLMGQREYQELKQLTIDFDKKYTANATARKRFKNKERRQAALDELKQIEVQFEARKEQREKGERKQRRQFDRKQGRTQAVDAFKQKVTEARQKPGGTQYQSELDAVDKKYNTAGGTRFAQGSPGWQSASESDLFWLRAKHVAAFKRNLAINELEQRIAMLKNGVRLLRERYAHASGDAKVNARKRYFGATTPAWVEHNTKLANMKAHLDSVDSRSAFLQGEIDAIQSDTEDTSTVNNANADLATTDDRPLLNFGTLEQEVRAAEQNVMDMALLRAARNALLPAYMVAPHLMNATMLTWLQTKVDEKPDLDPAGYDLEVKRRLQVQYEINGGYWLRNILGFHFVARTGQPTLYILDMGHITLNNRHGGGTTNYNVHLSVFADTITDARISCLDTAANIVDKLIPTNADEMKAAHVTLELWGHGHWPTFYGGNPNPHCYRGAPSAPKLIAHKTNDDWATVVRPALRLKLTTAIANFQAPVQAVVTNKGDAGFPLPGSLN